ncbi:RNA polymerase sigma factor [Facklamia miroungae]|uniref:RNA polymerase sigma factor n=1 Tax=Facklamia miroungae TaxID=120956 RepID=A0A1G7Q8A9_9LACT|nr:RNA polymerase sigma factor [Facklamia miroungae]NKZ28855.1 RNA polymerase sigma factor [Facklamia miroungae]SDF94723.1 RNA polymerase sigma-70 factor, ECF subfamily [Facklamia miroungae]
MDFNNIYLDYKDDVYRFITKLCDYQLDIADDITQEVFLKAYLNIEKYRGDSSIKTWLFTIAKNTFLDQVRKKQIKCQSIDNLENFGIADRHDSMKENENRELMELILKIIFDFPETMRLVFLARIYTEDSYEKISKDNCISVSSAKVLVCRARKKLKKSLKEEYHYEV